MKHFKNVKNLFILMYKKVIYIFNNLKILKKHMSINRSRKEIERRGDSISEITFGITREETKKFCI